MIDRFSGHSSLLSLDTLLEDNLPLYQIPSWDEVDGVLHMVMIPTLPRDYPDTVLDLLISSKCKEVSINYVGAPVEGEEERKKQFFVDLMQGLIHSSKKLKFEKTFDGKFFLSSKTPDIESQTAALGKVLGMALRAGCPIGEVFNLDFFRMLQASASTSRTWYITAIEDLKKQAHDRLVTHLKHFAFHMPETKCLEKVLIAEKTKEVKKTAKKLNRKWQDKKFDAAIEKGDPEQIKRCARNIWSTGFLEYARSVELIACEMMNQLPFTLIALDRKPLVISRWYDLSSVSTEEFAMHLQGRVTMAKRILRTRRCREFVEGNSAEFLKDPELLPLMLAAHPPGKQKNLCFYPIEAKQTGLELSMISAMPLAYPDEVIEKLTFVNAHELEIKYYGSAVIDRGGPKNQVFSDLMRGLIQSSKHYKFEKTDSGKVFPIATWSQLKTRDDRWKRVDYMKLGQVLGFALRVGSRIGDVFCKEFIHCLRTFSAADLNELDFSAPLYFIKKSDADLIAYMKDSTPPAETVRSVERALMSENEKDAGAAAKELNQGWCDDELTAALDRGDWDQIRSIVRSNWLAGYDDYFRAAHAIATGMEVYLPFKFATDNLEARIIKKWKDLAFVTTEELALQLQGRLSVEWIKNHLEFKPNPSPEAENVKMWVGQWFDDHEGEDEVLANVIQTLTGARALTSKIIFQLTPQVKGFYVHTCFQSVDVPVDIDEDGVRAVLDAYGRGEHLQFNRS